MDIQEIDKILDCQAKIIVEFLEKHKTWNYGWKSNKLDNENSQNDYIDFQEIVKKFNQSDPNKIKEATIKLKKELSDLIQKNLDNENNLKEICEWIIRDWGKINLGNWNKENISYENLLKNPEKHFKFDRIPSKSKIFSFYNPNQYAIYDTRVIYSINWILLKNGFKNGFYPLPIGRNSKLNAFNIEVLININNVGLFINKDKTFLDDKYISKIYKNIYISKDDAYLRYNKLIQKIAKTKNCSILEIEMQLFSIADNEIFIDILNSYKIK